MSGLEEWLTPVRVMTFVLVLARIVGLTILAPVFGSFIVPQRVRIALVVFLTVSMLPAIAAAGQAPIEFHSTTALVLALAAETSVGLMLGLIAQLVFGAVQMAGELAGMQMGLGLSSLIDPQNHDRVVVLAQWQGTLALLLFLTVDGHHVLIQAVAESFHHVPAGMARLSSAGLGMTVAFAAEIFVLALKLAAPVLILVLLTNATLGALGKLVPQLNVMVVGFPINVAAGFFILAAAQPFALRLLETAFGNLGRSLGAVIDALA
jgi:flagellar biosynthetic protein FliR